MYPNQPQSTRALGWSTAASLGMQPPTKARLKAFFLSTMKLLTPLPLILFQKASGWQAPLLQQSLDKQPLLPLI